MKDDTTVREELPEQHRYERTRDANTERRKTGGITMALAGSPLTRGSVAPRPADLELAVRPLCDCMKDRTTVREELPEQHLHERTGGANTARREAGGNTMEHTGDPLTRGPTELLPAGPGHAMRRLGARTKGGSTLGEDILEVPGEARVVDAHLGEPAYSMQRNFTLRPDTPSDDELRDLAGHRATLLL
jgi:hypothetical protein